MRSGTRSVMIRRFESAVHRLSPMFRFFFPVTLTAVIFLPLLALPLFLRFPNPLNNPLMSELHEFSHTGLFFLVELLLLVAIRYQSQWRTIRVLLIATCVGFAAGAVIELVQPFFGRTSSWLDMQRNLLGIMAANCAWLATRTFLDSTQRLMLGGVAVGILIFSGAGIYPWLIAQHKRDQAFPVIMDFRDSSLYRYANGAADGQLQIVPAPGSHIDIGPVAQLHMPGTAQWPGMRIINPQPDWSAYRTLKFDVYHPGPEDATLGLNIYSAQNRRKPWGYKAFRIVEGHNHLAYDLPGSTDRTDKITDFLIYSKSSGTNLTVYIDNIHLE